MSLIASHFSELEEAANDVYHLKNMSVWAEKNVWLEGKLISMSGNRQFQADIVNDDSRVTNTVKPAQIGLTTATIVYFLSGIVTQPKFNVIYALPSAGDASKLTVTKVNPIIYGSPAIKDRLDVNVDSVELKKIGDNFLFTRGCKSDTAALSISADCLVADEIDRSDPDVLKQFRSRLQASELAIIKQFSTPTIPKYGIAREAETSRRYRHMGKCHACGHIWLPSYHTDIVIPGFDKALDELTKYNIKDYKWQEARWNCPKCGRDPKFDPKTLEWVVENPLDNYESHTYYVSTVTACRLLLPAYLVRTSTEFNKRSEWQNQVLGETAEDAQTQLTQGDIEAAGVNAELASSNAHFMGCDMGLTCHIAIGRMTPDGLMVVHREKVPVQIFHQRRRELIREYRVITSVHDVYPYTTDIIKITDEDPNAWGAVFTTSKSPEMFTVQEKEENAEEGKLNLRLAKVQRTVAFDTLLDLFKKRQILVKRDEAYQEFIDHCLSVRRVQVFQSDELVFSWQKTDGNDHQFFALLYLLIACKLRGTASESLGLGSFGLVSKFAVRQKR